MRLNNKLIQYLQRCSKLNDCMLSLSNTKQVLLSVSPKGVFKEKEMISLELSSLLSTFNQEKGFYSYILNDQNRIPLYLNKHTRYASQIVLPLFQEKRLVGSLIMSASHKRFDEQDLFFALTTLYFLEKLLLL